MHSEKMSYFVSTIQDSRNVFGKMGEKAKTATPVTVPRLKLDQKSPKKQLKERPKSSSSSIDEVLSQSTTSKDG